MNDRDRGTPFQADCVAGNYPEIGCPPPVAETPPSQQVAETCRGERQDDAPLQPPAAGVTLTDDEREAVTLARDYCEARGEGRLAEVLSGLLARLGGGA
jgi:hypothetical protein